MAMTKTNEQLTMELNALSTRVQGLADSLENMMPEGKEQDTGEWGGNHRDLK